MGNDLSRLFLGSIKHLAIGYLRTGLQLRLPHHAVHVPFGLLHKLLPGRQQFLGALHLHRQLSPQLVQKIQHLIPVHDAHPRLERGSLGLLNPLIEHIN